MNTTGYVEITEKLRYGISALSVEHKDVSEPDEIMIRTTDGKIFYKRSDNQIVTEVSDYTKKDLISDMVQSGAKFNSSNTGFVVYNILDITGQSKISDIDKIDVGLCDIELQMPSVDSGFFIRVRGNDLINNAVSFIRSIYKIRRNEDSELNSEVSIELQINTSGESKVVEINCNFDELLYTDLNIGEPYTFNIISIRYPRLSDALSCLLEDERNSLKNMIMNSEFESATIDLVRLLPPDISDFKMFQESQKNRFGFIFPYAELYAEYHKNDISSIITISESKPEYPCIWAKVKK